MSENTHLAAEARTSFGKGAARKIRATNKIPAVIYGHGTEPRHVTLPGHETALLLRKKNVVLTIDIEGDEQLALVKDVQKDPVRQLIEHIDLIVIRKGEKVVVDVPLHLEGESVPGTIAMLEHTTISIEAEATHIPEFFVVSIDGAEDGTRIHAGEVKLPSGSTLMTDPESVVVIVATPQLDTTSDADGSADAGAEGEVAEGDEAAEGDAEGSADAAGEGDAAEAAE
jgi:large subunit ribosomal protein L25